MQVPVTAAQRQGGLAYKWIVTIVVIFGIFMSILDSTIVNIAIPRLQSVFGSNLNSVQWVLTAYTLAQGVATPLTAFLSDRVGIKRFYIFSLIAFTVGSALCGIAWSLPVLIFFRVLQGAGGAFLTPLAITMLYREFRPEERGTATGILGIPILLAPAFGPTFGGYLVTYASWQLIFYINVPIGIAGVILAFIFLRPSAPQSQLRLDVPGVLLSAIGLALLLYGLSDASTDGWTSGTVLSTLIVGGLLLIAFVFVEINTTNRGGQPLLDLRVFSNFLYTTSSIAMLLVTFALYGGLFLTPVYLQDIRGLSAFQAGLILLPQAFASMVAVVIGGRLVDRFGVRAIVIPGLVLLTVSLWLLSSITLTIPYSSFQWLLIMRGFALGLCLQPLTVSALSQIPPRLLGQGTTTNTALRFVGSSLAVAILATLVQSQTLVHYAHLAERVTASSPLGQLVPLLQALFISHGASSTLAYATALQEISGLVQRQAAVLAMQDGFRLSAILALVAIVASFFVTGQRRKQNAAVQPSSTPQEREEEERARQEAMIGG
jgi:EmrB/QacA subfamily drug resistance transporter